MKSLNPLEAEYFASARAYLENISLTDDQIDALQEKFGE